MEYHHGDDSYGNESFISLMNTAFKSSSSYSPSYSSSSSSSSSSSQSSSISTMSISSSSTLVNSVGGNLINMQNNNVNYSTQSSTVSSSPISNMAYSYDDESEKDLYQQYLRNQALETPILIALIIAYAILIFIGAFGNGLVCLVVARNPRMRTPQNLFIVNLAISDLLLCFFTIPFSLFEIATKFWPYGVAMCKLVLMLEATSIFVSTMSIIAIALDRYHVILHSLNPSMNEHKNNRIPILLKIILIWIIGIILSLPLCLVRTVNSHYIGIGPIDTIYFCIEKWPIENGRAYYSVFSMLIQYVIPIIIVTVVYTRLCLKLQSRTLRRTSTTQLPKLKTRLQRRARKTNLLLISIALIFFISWLPLNVLNIIADFCPLSSFKITFAVCHMFGMSSACSNPFLYGWLNQTFRNEFREIINSFNLFLYRFCCCCCCGCCECIRKNATNTSNMSANSNNIGSKQRKSELPNTGILQSGVQDSEHSTSFWHDNNHSQHQRVIHFRPKNDHCTIKDNLSNSNDNTVHHHYNHHPDSNNNCKIMIETYEKKGKNIYKNNGYGKVNFNLSNNINESSVQMMADLPTETTQVYLNNCNSMAMMDSDDSNNDEKKEKKEQEEEKEEEEEEEVVEEEEEKSSTKYDQNDQDFDQEQQHNNDEEFIINKDHNQHNENINFYLKSPNISNNNHNNNNDHHPHHHHQQCKFKRLSLADSRKRKRKDSAKQQQQQSKSPLNDRIDQYQYLEQNKNHQNPGFNDNNNNVETHNNENVIIVGDTDDYNGNHDHNDGDYGYCKNKNNNNFRFYDKNCAANTINNDRRKIF